MKVRALNIRPFAANGHFFLYYRSFFSLSSYPNAEYPAMKALKESLMQDGIPYTALQVDDVQGEYARMKALGAEFMMEPTNMGTTTVAILNHTCGNLIQIF